METIINPPRSAWEQIISRPVFDITQLFDAVRPILDSVRCEGDQALLTLEERFDHVRLSSLKVSETVLDTAGGLLDEALKSAIDQAYRNIRTFHAAQKFSPIRVETMPGVVCEQRSVPISRVGLYVPGGSAPLFSTVLMTGVPAQIAGCDTVVLCTPPDTEGKVHPAILYAAGLCGIRQVFTLGGAQAIAAMAFGTESVPKVDKIFGPGNQYVTAAKQLVSLSEVAIDMPAGPSEVEVLADDTCVPAFVAADLLSQAEHGADSQAMLVATDPAIVEAVKAEVERQLASLPRAEIAGKSLRNSKCIVFTDLSEAVDFTQAYAPEHLILAVRNHWGIAAQITKAGSIFLGNYSCESAGDYASGTNHTLPTKAWARSYSGLSLDSFMRKMTLQELSEQGVRALASVVEAMAAAESLEAHKRAMSMRRQALENS